jgi:hypothetical protein
VGAGLGVGVEVREGAVLGVGVGESVELGTAVGLGLGANVGAWFDAVGTLAAVMVPLLGANVQADSSKKSGRKANNGFLIPGLPPASRYC